MQTHHAANALKKSYRLSEETYFEQFIKNTVCTKIIAGS